MPLQIKRLHKNPYTKKPYKLNPYKLIPLQKKKKTIYIYIYYIYINIYYIQKNIAQHVSKKLKMTQQICSKFAQNLLKIAQNCSKLPQKICSKLLKIVQNCSKTHFWDILRQLEHFFVLLMLSSYVFFCFLCSIFVSHFTMKKYIVSFFFFL